MTNKKLHAEVCFKQPNLQAERGLRNVKLLSRARNVSDLDNFAEIF